MAGGARSGSGDRRRAPARIRGALLQRGTKLADAGDLDGAIAAHEAALARDPSLAQAHANLIALYGRDENWAKAEEHYRAVVALGFNLADAHYDYGVLLGMQDGGRPRPRRIGRRSHSIRSTRARTTISARSSSGSGSSTRRRPSTGRPSTASPRSGSRASISGGCWSRQSRSDDAIVELAEADRAARRRSAALPVCAGGRARPRGPRDEGMKWATDAGSWR